MGSGFTCTTSCRVIIDDGKLKQAIDDAPKLPARLEDAVQQITANANSLSSGYRTGIWHDPKTHEKRGNTQPKYVGDVKTKRHGPVGIVHPANYAAMKDNHEHNTLLKSLGGVHV